MAFIKDKTGSAQTAANAAAVVVAAFAGQFGSFKEAVEAYDDLRADIFGDLEQVVDADNTKFAAEADGSTSTKAPREKKDRSSKTGGSKRGGSKGGSSIDLESSLSMELNYGAFEGEKLGDVLKLTADECDEDYSYGDGERDGRDYISWLASDKNQNEFVQRRARVIADEEGIDY